MDPRVKPAGDVVGLRSIPFVIAGHSESKTRVNALMTRQSIRFAKSPYEERWTRGSSPRVTEKDCVIAGLDPAIHPLRKRFLRGTMDPRVKPAGDGVSPPASAYYDCGFHSRARFCASASWSEDISPATVRGS